MKNHVLKGEKNDDEEWVGVFIAVECSSEFVQSNFVATLAYGVCETAGHDVSCRNCSASTNTKKYFASIRKYEGRDGNCIREILFAR